MTKPITARFLAAPPALASAVFSTNLHAAHCKTVQVAGVPFRQFSPIAQEHSKSNPANWQRLDVGAPYPKISVDGRFGEVAKLNHVLNTSD
jgi:hypothetical protein